MKRDKKIIVAEGPDDFARRGADLFRAKALEAEKKKARFAVALSGGSAPRPMHRLLGSRPYGPDIPWRVTHIFWGDERCLPFEDPRSNYGTARADFLDGLPLDLEQIHPMPGTLGPGKGAAAYEEELRHFFQLRPGQVPVFDLIYLGMGPDGHTASLFPGHQALVEETRLAVPVQGGEPPVDRLTLTFPVLNRAETIVLLVSGKNKAGTVSSVFKDPDQGLPVQKIYPDKGILVWLLDREAASGLPKDLLRPPGA